MKDEKPYTERPNAHLAPINFSKAWEDFQNKFGKEYEFSDLLSYLFYPKVFADYHDNKIKYGNLSHLPTQQFFFGLKPNQEALIQLAPGKSILVKLIYTGETDDNGIKNVIFKLNGQTRIIEVKDKNYKVTKKTNKKATKPNEVGATLQGKLSKVLVKAGDVIQKGAPLFTIEAMKMESTIVAAKPGKVKSIALHEGGLVEQDDMIVEMEL